MLTTTVMLQNVVKYLHNIRIPYGTFDGTLFYFFEVYSLWYVCTALVGKNNYDKHWS